MDQATPPIRIVVAEPRGGPAGPDRNQAGDTAKALQGLGREVELVFVDDVSHCLSACEASEVDLVVLDRGLDDMVEAVLEALRRSGPPVVVVSRGQGDEEGLHAFRSGAADCIRVGPEYAEVLPAVALEQIRCWRRAREKGAAERRMHWLERLHHGIVTENPSALLVIDGRERVVMVNPQFSRAFGVQRGESESRLYREVLPTDLVESGKIESSIEECIASGSASPRLAHSRDAKAGRRTFDVRARRLDEEGLVLLVFSDVTDRETLAKRVGELQRYNENIIQNMNSALLVVDRKGMVTLANSTAEQILAAGAEELPGRMVWDWFQAPKEERPHIARTLTEGLRFTGAETILTLPDGGRLPIGISCAPLKDPDGRMLGAVAIFHDLTEIKELHRQVLQSEKMASIGQLAAGIAHEINNPMGFIHANLFQMTEYVTDLQRVWAKVEALTQALYADPEGARAAHEEVAKLSEELDIAFVLRDFAKAIRESREGSERIRHIVQDLREFSHHGTAERVAADINQCVDSTASIVWTMMKHTVVLKKEYLDLPPVHCFPMQLKQVFMNLLMNAYQAVREAVGDSGEMGEIRIRTRTEDGGVSISIEDSGVGIPSCNLDRIFDPFFTTKQVGDGTGLGLSTCYNIMRHHGGSIHVESEPGVGSTFRLWLPLHGSAADASPESASER